MVKFNYRFVILFILISIYMVWWLQQVHKSVFSQRNEEYSKNKVVSPEIAEYWLIDW